MKVKIGILTYHRSVNYGAFMQAYSLSTKIKREFPNCVVEIIDYESEETYRLYHKSFKNYLLMIVKASSVKKKLIYGKFLLQFMFGNDNLQEHLELEKIFEQELKNLPLSNEFIVTDDVNEFWKKIDNQYDIIVVGSDAVWNWQIKSFPNPYFLNSDSNIKRMSYAASSYGQDYLAINEGQKKYLNHSWSKYDYIGVRDIPTEKFVKSINPMNEPHHNCDPTVLLDLQEVPGTQEELQYMLLRLGVDITKPIVATMCKPWLAKVVRSIVDEEYQIVAVFFSNPYANHYVKNLTPFQWSKIFGCFDVVFTHFFHGNLLSLKNGTPTIPIEQKTDYNQKHDSKIRDFMKRLNLIDNCFYLDEVMEDKSKVRLLMKDMIENKDKYALKISKALSIESDAFLTFRDALGKCIEKIKNENQ